MSKNSGLLFFFIILVSQSPKRKMAIALLTSGIMFVNIWPVCVVAIQRQSVAREAKDKELAGQILCEASSKIDFRTTPAQAQWTVNVFPHVRMRVKSLSPPFLSNIIYVT